MLRKLFKWICSSDRCMGQVVAAHRPRTCPECRSSHTLRLYRRLGLPLKYLQCRKCGTAYAVAFRLKRCACGHTKFTIIRHDAFYKARSEAWRKATGRPATRGPIPSIDHFSTNNKVMQRRRA